MQPTTYQQPELRNANDQIIRSGTFGKNTALSNSTNDGWIDYVMNNLEYLHNTNASPTTAGLMSASDKTKLNLISSAGNAPSASMLLTFSTSKDLLDMPGGTMMHCEGYGYTNHPFGGSEVRLAHSVFCFGRITSGYTGRRVWLFLPWATKTNAVQRMWIGNTPSWGDSETSILWREITGEATTSLAGLMSAADKDKLNKVAPVGSIIAFAGASATPSGYLLCDGSAVSRTTYANLFAVIGTTYGSGNGSTTFNLPNLTDKVLQGSATAGNTKAAGLPPALTTRFCIKY